LLDDTGEVAEILQCAEKIQTQLQSPFQIEGHQFSTSASIGIALSSSGDRQAEDLLSDADKAMYRAKAHGRARHEVFDREVHARAVARLQMRSDLEQAIEERGFQVYYQPIINLETGFITGFEALGRWLHPSRGLVSPTEFIPLAEETGLIIDIGRWLMQDACSQVVRWQDTFQKDPPLKISLNLTSREFTQPDLIPAIQEVLANSGLSPAQMSLEIAEGVILENPELRAVTLEELQNLGVQVFIDDFGTGHASFNFMYSFPIDALKIDHSFIHRIGSEGENAEIVRTIILLARDYGMQVIGEGIETAAQLAVLRDLRCRYGQGYYFARPMDAANTEALLASDPHW
jgi:EAL domain-containing protein (putative c-di-GMP-specific phosphodiesterase class I)